MSAHHQVFIRTPAPVSRLLADISTTVQAPMQPVQGGPASYAADDGHAAVEIELSHDYSDDGAMDFTAYPILVTIRDYNRDHHNQERLARHIASSLAARGHSVLVTFDLQRILDRQPGLPPA